MSEFDLIDRAFRAKLPFTHSLTTIAAGDDASVHAVPAGFELVVSTDMSLAGVHWPHDFPLQLAACRAVNSALSDLAAMGAEPCWIWCCAALCDAQAAESMGDGIALALQDSGIELAGGDTVHAPQNSLSVTVAGIVPAGTAMRRDTAKPDDDLWLCGDLGTAAEALRCWQQGDHASAVMQAFGTVQPRFADGMRLREAGVRCCIDVSDGLLADAAHLAGCSGVGMQIELSSITSFCTLAQRLNTQDAANLVLGGGEDYALLCTAPAALREELAGYAVRIGRCTKQQGVHAMLHGETITAEKRGYDHFI